MLLIIIVKDTKYVYTYMYLNLEKNSWLSSCDSYQVYRKNGHKYLIAYLYDGKGNNIKIKLDCIRYFRIIIWTMSTVY